VEKFYQVNPIVCVEIMKVNIGVDTILSTGKRLICRQSTI